MTLAWQHTRVVRNILKCTVGYVLYTYTGLGICRRGSVITNGPHFTVLSGKRLMCKLYKYVSASDHDI